MTYFNPKIYNYKNLHEDDKKLFNYYDLAVEDVKKRIEILLDVIDDSTVIGKIQKEICEQFGKDVLEDVDIERDMQIVSIIDNYDEEVEEVEE